MSKNAQDLIFGEARRSAVMLEDTAYEQVAIALGCYGERVTDVNEIAPALARARASGKPACINIATDPDVMHPITFGMAGTDPQKRQHTMPYHQNEQDRTTCCACIGASTEERLGGTGGDSTRSYRWSRHHKKK